MMNSEADKEQHEIYLHISNPSAIIFAGLLSSEHK